MKKLLFITLILSLMAIGVFAQDKAAESRTSGTPIGGIIVKITDANENVVQEVSTDNDGRFEIKNLSPGKYIIEVGKRVGKVKFENINLKHTISSPRDPATGMATGKREAGSGMATGKRMHKPLVITMELDRPLPADKGITQSGIKKTDTFTLTLEAVPSAPIPVTETAQRVKTKSNHANDVAEPKIDRTAAAIPLPVTNPDFIVALDLQEKDMSLVGRVLKTKHDTVKNSINNVR